MARRRTSQQMSRAGRPMAQKQETSQHWVAGYEMPPQAVEPRRTIQHLPTPQAPQMQNLQTSSQYWAERYEMPAHVVEPQRTQQQLPTPPTAQTVSSEPASPYYPQACEMSGQGVHDQGMTPLEPLRPQFQPPQPMPQQMWQPLGSLDQTFQPPAVLQQMPTAQTRHSDTMVADNPESLTLDNLSSGNTALLGVNVASSPLYDPAFGKLDRLPIGARNLIFSYMLPESEKALICPWGVCRSAHPEHGGACCFEQLQRAECAMHTNAPLVNFVPCPCQMHLQQDPFDDAFSANHYRYDSSGLAQRRVTLPGLFFANRTIYNQAMGQFWAKNIFRFNTAQLLFLVHDGNKMYQRERMRKIQIEDTDETYPHYFWESPMLLLDNVARGMNLQSVTVGFGFLRNLNHFDIVSVAWFSRWIEAGMQPPDWFLKVYCRRFWAGNFCPFVGFWNSLPPQSREAIEHRLKYLDLRPNLEQRRKVVMLQVPRDMWIRTMRRKAQEVENVLSM
ncbi:hypothetical protein BDY21DRAFT_80410 [Lineolata rhizophorae]|uniref:Uncharacterized protein n=1 Tax=Lineolata rhizophorae TaxID=578093 RepID=A0A6A6NUB8_9PEZI|nr:hypothetical protein BDY21DRAFT_80410 [Lineolata rhizophorae]